MSTHALPIAEELRWHSIDRIDGFRVVAWPAGTFYQIAVSDRSEPIYLEVSDGQILADGDRAYAKVLARHYLGNHDSAIRDTTPVREFDDEYTSGEVRSIGRAPCWTCY